jgi:HEAT repeat protein
MDTVNSSWRGDWTKETRPSEEILALALAESDEDTQWYFIAALRCRGGETEFRLAAQLTAAANPDHRCIGAQILAQLGPLERSPLTGVKATFVTESVDLLLPMLADQDPSVVCSAAYALGHRGDDRAIGPLCQLVDYPDADVRHGVASALGGFEDDRAIQVLLRLTTDADESVRDWATFAIGSLIETDTPEIRSALLARMDEDNGEIRGEALVGLARRNDSRTLPLVRAELQRPYAGGWVLEAAELLGDSSLIPLLTALRDRWGNENEHYFGAQLNEALEACAARPPD